MPGMATEIDFMQNEDPPCWKVLTFIEQLFLGYADLSGLGGIAGITEDNIAIWHRPAKTADRKKPFVNMPGIVISAPRGVASPADAGTVCWDYIYLNVSIQIVDTLMDPSDRDKMRSYWKWYHNMMGLLHMQNLRAEVTEALGIASLAWNGQFDPLDERQYAIHDDCVAAFALTVKLINFRDPRGSV